MNYQATPNHKIFRALTFELDGMRQESGLYLGLLEQETDPFRGVLKAVVPRGGALSDSDQLDWLKQTANCFVTMLRPRLSQAAAAAEADDRQ